MPAPSEISKVDELIRSCLSAFTKRQVDEHQSLFGSDGLLESIQLVSFLISVEQQIQEQFGKDIRIVSEKAFSAGNSPFRNIHTLRDWIFANLGEEIG